MNNNNKSGPGGLGNSSNPRPGQSPFPQAGPLVRQTPTDPQSSQPYTSSYSNNFDRSNARFSTGRTEESRYSQERNDYTIPPQSPPRQQPRREQAGRAWEDSIYGMYGDMKTPREPPPRQNQQSRRQYQQEQQEDEDSYDEEVPRRPSPEAQRPRYDRSRTSPGPEPRRANTTRQNPQNERSARQDQQDRRDRRGQQNRQEQRDGDGNYRRVHINIDTGGDGSRSWSWNTDDRDRANVNIGTPFGGTSFGGTPLGGSGPSLVNFGDSAFPFGGRNNNGGRLPVNVPFVNGLPINLPFGL